MRRKLETAAGSRDWRRTQAPKSACKEHCAQLGGYSCSCQSLQGRAAAIGQGPALESRSTRRPRPGRCSALLRFVPCALLQRGPRRLQSTGAVSIEPGQRATVRLWRIRPGGWLCLCLKTSSMASGGRRCARRAEVPHRLHQKACRVLDVGGRDDAAKTHRPRAQAAATAWQCLMGPQKKLSSEIVDAMIRGVPVCCQKFC